MRRADRLYRLIELLRGGRLTTARKLAEALEVSERTVYRDIADLQASGLPVEGEAGVGYQLSGYELPPLMFSLPEVEALAAGARIMRSWGGKALAQGAASALEKIAAVLPEDLAGRMEQTPIHAPDFMVPEAMHRHLDALAEAIREQQLVEILYRDAEGQDSQRLLRPLGLHFWGGAWTLAAWCELRAGFRNFRLDRITRLSLPGRRFEIEPGRSLDDFLAAVSRD